MKYEYNEPQRKPVPVFTIILGLLLIFMTYVALTCSNEAREAYNRCDDVIYNPDNNTLVCERFIR